MAVPNTVNILQMREKPETHEHFIKTNKRFILASAYKAAGRFITDSCDEYSVALIAFEEAIRSYDPSKGNFYSFAGLVIKRRVYDFLNSEARHNSEIPVRTVGESDTEEEDSLLPVELEVKKSEVSLSMASTETQPESTPIQDEIAAMQNILNAYGFSFFDLVECSPKAEKTKAACILAIGFLLDKPDLFLAMRADHKLPIKPIHKKTGLSRKILERHRKYIIAVTEILNGDFPQLAEYLKPIRKEVTE